MTWSRFSLAINLFADSPTGILMLINCASPPQAHSLVLCHSSSINASMLLALPDPFISNHLILNPPSARNYNNDNSGSNCLPLCCSLILLCKNINMF